MPKKRHSFRPLLFAPPQGPDALPPTVPPPPRALKRSANDSHIRLRAQPLPRAADIDFLEAQDLLEELCEDQLTMSMSLAGLEESIGQGPRDASSRGAVR